MRKYFLTLISIICAGLAWAVVEKSEIMTILKNDGTKIVYNVADIEKVSFEIDEQDYQLMIVPQNGDALKLNTIPAVFRALPAKDGDPYQFGLSTVEATDPDGVRTGDYGVVLTVSALSMNEADVDLADGKNAGAYATLYSYKDGEVDKTFEAQTAGKLTTAVDNKTKAVTIKLEATYDNGTEITVDFKGAVTDVENLEGFNPPTVYVNQGQYFNADGNPTSFFEVQDMKYTPGVEYRGVKGDRFDFTLSNEKTCYFILDPKYFDNTFDFATAGAGECYFVYDNIQLATKDTPYMNVGNEGTINVVRNEDNSFTVDFCVTNKYTPSWGGTGGTPEYVVLNYTSDAFEPEPEPIVVENQLVHVDNEGNIDLTYNVKSVTRAADKAIPNNSSVKGDRFDIVFEEENAKTVYLIIKPELVGTSLDIAEAPAQSYYFKYGANEVVASDLSFLSSKVGKEGTITFTENEDNSLTLDINVSLATSGNPDVKERVVLNCKIAAPEPVVLNNQMIYTDRYGAESAPKNVTKVERTADQPMKYDSKTGDKFAFTIEGESTDFYLIIDPEYIGKTIDFATAPDKSYFIKYSYNELAAPNLTYMTSNVGDEGKITVTKNEDNSYTVDMDFSFNKRGSYSTTKEHIVLNATTAPEAEPEPEPGLKDAGIVTNTAGAKTDVTVTNMTSTPAVDYNKLTFDKYEFEFSNSGIFTVYIAADQYGKEIDFASAPNDSYYITYSNGDYNMIDLGAPNSVQSGRYNEGKEGSLKVVKNEDGSYTFDVDVKNIYKSFLGDKSYGDRVQLNYTSAAPEPEPEPEPGFVNQGQHYTADGVAENVFDVTGMAYAADQKISGVSGFDKFTLTLSNGIDCYIAIKPEYVGQEIDFETADKDSFVFKYGYNMNYGTKDNTMFVPQGVNGKIKVEKTGDSYTVNADVMAHYINYGTLNNTSKERVVLNYTPATVEPEPEPEPEPGLVNEGTYTTSAGKESKITVTGSSFKANYSINGLKLDQYEIELSNDYALTVYIDPKYYGQKIDFANAPDDSYFVEYGDWDYTMFSYGANNTVRPGSYNTGRDGSLKIVRNDDGTYVIDADVSGLYYTGAGTPWGDAKRIVLNCTKK